MTLLCVPITVRDEPGIDAALAEATQARNAGADLVEYRIDEFFSGEGMTDSAAGSVESGKDTPEVAQLLYLVAHSPVPCIVTCRAANEGGTYEGDEMARVSLYERLGTAFGRLPGGEPEEPPRYLDFELASFERSANIRQKIKLAVEHPEQVRDLKTSLILSIHDFQGRPADLTRRLARVREIEAAKVIKVAYRARSIRDNLELFDLLRERDRPMIALGMGEFGLMSRILAPKFGGHLTFASLRAETATAPGQPTVPALLDTYRFRAIGSRTRVYGIIGWPVGHSLSPLVHNAGFDELRFDGVYVPMPVAATGSEPGKAGETTGAASASSPAGYESLKATLLELLAHDGLDFSGASVTIPHKENLVRLAREQEWDMDELAEGTSSANTVVVERSDASSEARVRIVNTDGPGAIAWLESAMGPLAGKRVAIFGTGGVARALAGALAQTRAAITIVSRTRPKADRLVAELRAAVGELIQPGQLQANDISELSSSPFDVIINATPVGMSGGPDPSGSPVRLDELTRSGSVTKDTIVADTVYNPIDTPMLVQARQAGCRVLDGVGMFVKQAEMQFRLWTNVEPPTGLFEQMVRRELSRVRQAASENKP